MAIRDGAIRDGVIGDRVALAECLYNGRHNRQPAARPVGRWLERLASCRHSLRGRNPSMTRRTLAALVAVVVLVAAAAALAVTDGTSNTRVGASSSTISITR